MAESGTVAFWDTRVMEPVLTEEEIKLRNAFVVEYLKDYDQTAACMRLGFAHGFAEPYGKKFYAEAYVQKRIKEIETRVPTPAERKEIDAQDAALVRSRLRYELHYGTSASRVSALSKLAGLLGMDTEAKKNPNDNKARGGVMMVPGIADISEWEEAAMASQAKLQQDSKVV